jgi:T-complex protein 1 subunit gamma
MMNAPVLVLNANTQREQGRKAQLANIRAAKAIADVIKTCLGPRAMLKMVLDPMGGIQITNDGHAILREIDVSHPAAKSMIELSRSQDENTGDGTTSVAILAGEILAAAEPWLEKNIHPQVIINTYKQLLDDALEAMEKFSVAVDINNRQEAIKIIQSGIGTKFISRWSDLFCGIALDAVKTVYVEEGGRKEIDIKRYVRVEKMPGGEITDCKVIPGVVLNKDITHPKMRRRIENPRIILLDCPLEYKKAESMMNIQVTEQTQWTDILRQEEEEVIKMCNEILKFKPDLVLTEKGLSDLAQHVFVKNDVTALRRLRKMDNNRIARATGATIVSRTDEIQESDVGTGAGLFEVEKIGDDYFAFITDCKNPKACTIMLRGANKEVLNEIDRNLSDALNVARNVFLDSRLVPGGGAIEMALSQYLMTKASSIEGVQQWIYKSLAGALEIIPRILAQNCGAKTVKVLTDLRAKHVADPQNNYTWGVDGLKGTITDMKTLGVWDSFTVKSQTLKSAIESAILLLRVDDVVSGLKKRGDGGNAGGAGGAPNPEEMSEMAE